MKLLFELWKECYSKRNIAWDGEEKSEGGSELVMLERGEGETRFWTYTTSRPNLEEVIFILNV